MDLSKAFDCIYHDFLIAKLSAYGFKGTALKYIYSYLKNLRQGIRLNNSYSDLKGIVSGVPQRSIADPTVFNTFLKMIFSFTLNIIYHHLQRLIELIRTLLLESNNTINWFSENKMIVNPDKLT